jgi:hypothetical protein
VDIPPYRWIFRSSSRSMSSRSVAVIQPRSIRIAASVTSFRAAHAAHASENFSESIKSNCNASTPNSRLRSVSIGSLDVSCQP